MVPMFIQTKDNILWFTFNRINDEYICFPKIVDNYKGKNYSEWYEKPIQKLKKYQKKLDGLDEYVYVISENNVVKKYDSLEFVKNERYLSLKYGFDNYVKKIIAAIENFFDIDRNNIGIEGSILLDCYNEESDIDILVFGKDNALKIQKKFIDFCNYKDITLFDYRKAYEYVEKRKTCGYGNNLELLKKQFLRRYYGFVDGKQFSIVCVPNEYQDGYIDLNRNIKYDSNVEEIYKVVDSEYSCMIPSIYEVIDKDDNKFTVEVFNHYGINQIKNGEKVFIKGKKYINCSNDKSIIILSFWSNVNERFDLYE